MSEKTAIISFSADNSATFKFYDVPIKDEESTTCEHAPASDFRLCEPLQHFIEVLRTITDEMPKDDIRFIYRQSIETFITEANKHREYCNVYTLRDFSNVIYEALSTFFWEVNGDIFPQKFERLRTRHKEKAITASELNAMHEAHSLFTADDTYICRSNDFSFLIIQIIYAMLLHYFKRGYIVGVCQNCGKVFITENRSDEKYCKRTSPQDSEKTCAQYMKYEKQKIHNSSELKKEYSRILRRLTFTEAELFKRTYREIPTANKSERAEYLRMWAEKYPKREQKGEK